MPQLTLSILGKKYELEASEEEGVRAVKQRLEVLCNVPAEQQKWLVKGKEAFDQQTIGTLGAFKVMVLRNQAGYNTANTGSSRISCQNSTKTAVQQASSTASQPADVEGPDSGAKRTTAPYVEPIALGDGPCKLTVSHGRQHFHVFCHEEATIAQIKILLAPACGAPQRQQRLLVKGKEARDDQSIASLNLSQGGRLMLLFREGQHQLIEGTATLCSCSALLADLTRRITEMEVRKRSRLDDTAVILAAIGALEAEVRATQLDIENAKVASSNERLTSLNEIEGLSRRLKAMRDQLKGT